MEHRAYIFDYDGFESELKPILEHALNSGESEDLIAFIEDNLDELKDPDMGAPLDADWQAMLGQGTVHEYGALAVTKYYEPAEDMGLAEEWEPIHLLAKKRLGKSPLLGHRCGPAANPFDPTRQGAYFQSPDEVVNHLELARELEKADRHPSVEAVVRVLEAASDDGLFVTF